MAISIFSNSGKEHYGIKHYVVDTEAEAIMLPTSDHPGSTAFVIENSSTYMLNNTKQWKKVFLNSGYGGGNGNTTSELNNGDTAVWDSGNIGNG